MELIHGPIPAETGISKRQWTVECLGKMAEITTGKKDVNEGNPDGEYPFFTCSRTHTFSDSYSFDTESILIAGNGDVGNLHYFKGKFEAYQRTYVAHNFKCDVTYIWHQLNYRLTESLGLGKIGSSIPYIKKENLTGFEFPLPHDRSEQRAIATALSDVDALIAGLERLIAKKRDIKQAAMQQLLTGQTRLPGFSGEWAVKELGELCSLKSGQTITTESIDDHSPYRCFGGNGLRGFTATYTHDGSHVLIGRQGALCGNVIGVTGKFFASEHALVASVRSDVASTWLTYVLGRMNLNQYSESSAQPGLSAAKLLVLDVLTPPTRDEQTAIATVLSDMDADLTALESRLAKTRAIKQGMMQELLTGRTRLLEAK